MLIKNKTSILVIQNFLVFVLFVILIELASFSILYIHKLIISNKTSNIDETYKKKFGKGKSFKNSKYSSDELERELIKARSKENEHYQYSSHLVYKNKKFSSKYINVDSRGIRLNKSKKDKNKNNLKEINIWFSGSSSIYGVTNADHQTIPAYLERQLENHYPNTYFNVLNLGVVGYTSIQELLNIRFRMLSEFKKPDIIIVMNGVNDYHHAFLSKEDHFDGLLRTGIGSDKILKYYWSFHNEKKLFNKEAFLRILIYTFSNTINLSNKVNKYFVLKKANSNIKTFTNSYLEKKQNSFELVEKNLVRNKKFYLGNMKLIISLAKENNIKVLFILQPTLYEAKRIKNLVEQEVTEYIHSQTGYFAINQEKITKLKKISSELVMNKYFWDLEQYVSNYKKLREELNILCLKEDVPCLDIMPTILRNKDKPIFSSPWHYTYIGAEIFGSEIKDELAKNKYFQLSP